ncbi:unnamed protein product, partial [Prorocentrum cordatum]
MQRRKKRSPSVWGKLMDFLDIHNPRAVLENSLRNFATLTVGDSIVINYNQKTYEIEVVECKPTNAISIIEADVNVDFAPPKDYQEPERQAPASSSSFTAKVEESEVPVAPPQETGPKLFGGQGQRVDGKAIKTPQASPALGPSAPPVEDLNELMPWKNRLHRGVKMVRAPPGIEGGHMTGRKAGGAIPTLIEDHPRDRLRRAAPAPFARREHGCSVCLEAMMGNCV